MTGHLGLRPGVRTLRELGFFYVDNGFSTLRLSSAALDRLKEAGSAEAAALPATKPEFFATYPTQDAARHSFDVAELSIEH